MYPLPAHFVTSLPLQTLTLLVGTVCTPVTLLRWTVPPATPSNCLLTLGELCLPWLRLTPGTTTCATTATPTPKRYVWEGRSWRVGVSGEGAERERHFPSSNMHIYYSQLLKISRSISQKHAVAEPHLAQNIRECSNSNRNHLDPLGNIH